VRNTRQHAWMAEAHVEDVPLVDQVRQALGTGFLVHLNARPIALSSEKFVHARAQTGHISLR